MSDETCIGSAPHSYTPKNLRRSSAHMHLPTSVKRIGRVASYIKGVRAACAVKDSRSVEDAVAIIFSPGAEFIRPSQQPSEILSMLTLIVDRRPAVVVEIGTASGGNLLLLAQAAARDALIVSIDLPGGEFGGGYGWWRIPLYQTFASPKQVIKLIRGDSHAQATIEQLLKILGGKEIDFLFIDGDHTYEGVSRDFLRYGPLVRPGGMIAVHDIVEHSGSSGCDVYRFWRQVKRQFEHTEIVEDWESGFAGIGLIRAR